MVKHAQRAPSPQEDGEHSGRIMQVAVQHRLRDPDSAQFERVDVVANSQGSPYQAVATVRAKNGFGGYTVSTFTCAFDPADGYRVCGLTKFVRLYVA